MTRNCNTGAVTVTLLRWMLSIRIYVARLAVRVTISAMGATTCIRAAGWVMATAVDMGAMTVKFEAFGPVPMNSHAVGET